MYGDNGSVNISEYAGHSADLPNYLLYIKVSVVKYHWSAFTERMLREVEVMR